MYIIMNIFSLLFGSPKIKFFFTTGWPSYGSPEWLDIGFYYTLTLIWDCHPSINWLPLKPANQMIHAAFCIV